MFNSDQSVYVSYAWGSEAEEIVNQIDEALQRRGIKIVRDRRDLDYKGSISDFMERIGQGNCVIVVISDRYMRSTNCMFELLEIAEGKQYRDRVFPIVLGDANIFDPVKRIEYARYWEVKQAELANAMRALDPANLQGIREEMDQYDRIREKIYGLTDILKDMNTLTPEMHKSVDFGQLLAGIERSMKEVSSPITKSEGDARSPASNVQAENGSVAIGKIEIGGNVSGNIAVGNPNSSLSDEVSFTAYHSKEGEVDTWHTLLVYTHLLSALPNIQNDAKRFSDQIASPKETTSRSSTEILRGTEITIIPTCKGITFNPPHVSFKWMEIFHRAEFRFIADTSLLDDAAKGEIDIFAGPLIIGSLKFAMLFNDKNTSPTTDYEEHARMYNKDDVFISYSRKDKEVARAFKNVLEATGLDVFLDVDDIRTGQFWQDELLRRIERAKIFQIFWSPNYSESENCRLEWEYALKQNKEEGYIRPIFWSNPLSPRPPEELNKYNFKYVNLNQSTT